MTVKVFSLNIWNINSPFKERMQTISTILQDFQPNLVFFQEVSPDPMSGSPQYVNIYSSLDNINHHYSSTGFWKGREEGLAILSSFPMKRYEQCMLPEAPYDMPRQIMTSILYYKHHKILIANTHLAYNINLQEERVIQIRKAINFLEKIYNENKCDGVIFSGDLNSTPSSKVISEIKKCKFKFKDVFEGTNWRKEHFTFSSKNPFVNEELVPDRWIDYIFVSQNFNVNSCNLILQDIQSAKYPSDHFALTAEVSLK